MDERPYVLVIHGTWNPPVAGQRHWYQLDETNPANFCRVLNDCLQAAGIGRPVWHPVDGEPIEFAWTGANDHQARLQAARDLCNLILKITSRDTTARIHLVAHSHGGNVVLKAIELYIDHLREEAESLRRRAIELLRGRSAQAAFEEALQATFGRRADAIAAGAESALLVLRDELTELDATAPGLRFLTRGRRLGSAVAAKYLPFPTKWAFDRASNRLGRVVFLGTPFFRKVWARRSRSVAGWLHAGVDFGLDVLMFGVLGYIVALAVWFFLWLSMAGLWVPFYGFLGSPPFPRIDPLTWPLWLLVLVIASTVRDLASISTVPVID